MSTSVGVSTCCLSGKIQDGTPKGHVETIGGLNTYVSEPESGSKAKTVIFITDIFGWEFKNIRLLADAYAAAGFYTYIPDFQDNDALPSSFLTTIEPNLATRETLSTLDTARNTAAVAATMGPWFVTHREAVTRPRIDGFVNAVRQIPGTNKIGAIGFCWGGRYAILQAHGRNLAADDGANTIGGVDAAYACHPSLVSVPEDFEPVTKPLSLALGTKDSLLDQDTVGKIIDTLAKKTEVVHEVRLYEDQVHGFALRGDWSRERDKEAMDQAQRQGIEWFEKYLA